VTESSGSVKITIVKKVSEEMLFYVRTKDDTAKEPKDYVKFEKLVQMSAKESEHSIEI